MVQEPKKEESSESDKAFEQMSSIVPPREVDMPEETGGNGDGGGHDTLEERMESSPKLSDMQTADKRLFPDLAGKLPIQWINKLMVSRVFPDIYNPLFRICVKELVRNTEMSVAEAIAYVNTAISIAIDGEGRIDEIRITGRAAEAESDKSKMV